MTTPADTGTLVARALIDAGCVTLRTDEPFRLPSGWASPMYMDCRRLISFPAIRRIILAHGIDLLERKGCLRDVVSIVGAESSGIALAAWFADALDLPMQYVRKRAIGASQIEGVIRQGETVLLVDDLMAAGHSKARFVRALRDAGANVTDLFVVFDYSTFRADRLLEPLGLKVHALATWQDVAQVACERGDFTGAAMREMTNFLREPAAWSQANGGKGDVSATF